MRVVAILSTFNEERFIADCLENLIRQNIEVYLIDNDSTDQTVAIARRFSGRGLVGLESLPRNEIFSWSSILRRKEQLAATLEADWFMHVDADEVYPSPRSGITLAETFAEVEAQGYNAVNFMEFTFIPTQERPDHDHPGFLETMQWYYPFMPAFPDLIRAWKRQPVPAEIAWSGGHLVRFPGLRLYPETFPLQHYHFLSVPHAIRKYVFRQYDPSEVQNGWHGWRARLRPDMIKLPPQAELRTYVPDYQLDRSNPHTIHCFFDQSEQEAQLRIAKLVGNEQPATKSQLEKNSNSLEYRCPTAVYKLGALLRSSLKTPALWTNTLRAYLKSMYD